MAHDYGKSMVVDQIEADVVISDGMESLFPILIHLVDSREWHMTIESPW